jgi:type IV pilus assembly protein PilP
MIDNKYYVLFGVLTLLVLSGCSKGSNEDLKTFISVNKERPPGKIEPLKQYPPYKPYSYSAQGLRSPFIPTAVMEQKILAPSSNVTPIFGREKQPLESFGFNTLTMVGTVKKGSTLWALIRNPEGTIERVKVGYYLGKDNGRITEINNNVVDVIEIVTNGNDGWLERPNQISLKEK